VRWWALLACAGCDALFRVDAVTIFDAQRTGSDARLHDAPSDAVPDARVFVGPRLVFVTSMGYSAAFGGLGGADGLCQGRAAAVGMTGTYKAWLSTSVMAARDHLLPGGAPIEFMNTTHVAETWDLLLAGPLESPINVTELGNVTATTCDVWTNTRPDGTILHTDQPSTCSDFSSTSGTFDNTGDTAGSDATWTDNTTCSTSCGTPLRLYCFED
jgi:hypothetical protein